MAAAPPARAPQALMDEIVEEIILRLPPSEPASLVRAALVCKPWCGLISSPRFRRRFREFHRTAPMLGFICNTRKGLAPYVARFVPTSSFRPPRADHRDWLFVPPLGWNATVLCAASGAGDHLDCLHRRFLVVLMSSDFLQSTLRVYSSESGSWSQQTLVPRCGVDEIPAALVGNTIYFSIDVNSRIVSYDLATREASVICLPPNSAEDATTLLTMEDGG